MKNCVSVARRRERRIGESRADGILMLTTINLRKCCLIHTVILDLRLKHLAAAGIGWAYRTAFLQPQLVHVRDA